MVIISLPAHGYRPSYFVRGETRVTFETHRERGDVKGGGGVYLEPGEEELVAVLVDVAE